MTVRAQTPAATSGGGRASTSRDTGTRPGLPAGDRRALQELVDAADAVTWGLSLKMSGIVWRLRETTVPTVLELELVLERAARLHDALEMCRAFVVERAGERP